MGRVRNRCGLFEVNNFLCVATILHRHYIHTPYILYNPIEISSNNRAMVKSIRACTKSHCIVDIGTRKKVRKKRNYILKNC